jgi:hypothetical protein
MADLTATLYDKRGDFNFENIEIANFPFLCSNILS